MIVVYAMSRNLYHHFLPTLRSLLEHNKPTKVYILAEDDSLPYELPDVCEVINVSDQKWYQPDGPNMTSIFTYIAMVRACYVYLFPNTEKVLQLDVDTIICDDLTPLWEIDLTEKWFAACPEYKGKYNPFGKEKYYNIGVCVYNLEQMRKDGVVPKLVDCLNHQRMLCVEQDAINLFGVPDKVVDIPVRYNESFCCGYTDNPAVVHFAGHADWYCTRSMIRVEYLDKYR